MKRYFSLILGCAVLLLPLAAATVTPAFYLTASDTNATDLGGLYWHLSDTGVVTRVTGTSTTDGLPSATKNVLYDTSAAGEVGQSTFANGTTAAWFKSAAGAYTNLTATANLVAAYGINDAGDIVGYANLASTFFKQSGAIVYHTAPTVSVNFNTLLRSSLTGGSITSRSMILADINNSGQVLSYSGQSKALETFSPCPATGACPSDTLAFATPEPKTTYLAGIGGVLVVFGLFARKRELPEAV